MMFIEPDLGVGSPEVYILFFPPSAYSPKWFRHSGQPLFGYRLQWSMATMAICVLSFTVCCITSSRWVPRRCKRILRHRQHAHRPSDRREDLQLALQRLYEAALRSVPPCCGGRSDHGDLRDRRGMTGCCWPVPPADFVLHNSLLFLVAHSIT